ncbi:mechanosensitive ion channel family protein [Thermodesulfobacterium hydrogeniphilum]|uniref:mechanosensitive ion channel family protein n=1 Tax=Thermodesulfobacterium hydrogeniphilum TaxID=161156 RepID=UPI00068E676B|nr:mechanosensitive ion channel family protein [Thermodesulfobacterium hydrogeniphilum]
MEPFMKFFQDVSHYLNFIILGVPIYKIALSIGVFLLSIFLRKVFVVVIFRVVERFVKKTSTEIDDIILQIISKPLTFLFIIGGIFFALLILGIEHIIISKILKTLFIFVFAWILYNAVIISESYIYSFAEKFGKEISQEIGSFFIKLCKIFIIGLATLSILQDWGINVSAVIASLGLGGLAFALAAKDTVANLFGGLTVLIDKTMKIGDWIKIGDMEGIVEDIGLRTTKIRSFEKSLITIPNQMLANQFLENFSKRNVRRIKMIIGVTYDTTREQMVKILEEIRNMLKNHPKIAKDQLLMVYFTDFGDSSLNIFIYCFTNTAVWEEYLAIKEDVNLKIMEIIERNGASFAFPSTSIYVEKLPELPLYQSKERKNF